MSKKPFGVRKWLSALKKRYKVCQNKSRGTKRPDVKTMLKIALALELEIHVK